MSQVANLMDMEDQTPVIDRVVDSDRAVMLNEIAVRLPDLVLDDRQQCDLELLATGVYSPLAGYVGRSNYESILNRMRLQNGRLWPVPTGLQIPALKAATHPGVAHLLKHEGDYYILGHDHAGPGCNGNGARFYDPDQSCKLAAQHAEEIGIDILPFEEIVYLPFEDEFRPAGEVPHNTQTISLSGSDIGRRFRTGRRIPEWASFPEVIRELEKAYPPPSRQGFTIFFTGLSGAGKSTIARILYSRFLEIGDRPVTLLDGDIVRQNLSSELSFSREHRDINVLRIGFVASEITKNRGIAICAPIAPYAATRREIRSRIEANGGYIEVHVATPLEVCEQRDRKGMYAKARAGLIKGYTGIDDPYEVPETPEVRTDTSVISPDQAAREVLLFLFQRGFI